MTHCTHAEQSVAFVLVQSEMTRLCYVHMVFWASWLCSFCTSVPVHSRWTCQLFFLCDSAQEPEESDLLQESTQSQVSDSLGGVQTDLSRPEVGGGNSEDDFELLERENSNNVTSSQVPTTKTYCCYLCPYESKYQSNLMRHQKTHTARPSPAVDSSGDRETGTHTRNNGQGARKEGELMRPRAKKRSGVNRQTKRFCCRHCSFRTKYKDALKRHVNFIHSEATSRDAPTTRGSAGNDASEKPFVCEKCQKRFTRKSRLNEHKHTHTKRFKCTYCGHRFAHKRFLVYHHEREHTDESSLSQSQTPRGWKAV